MTWSAGRRPSCFYGVICWHGMKIAPLFFLVLLLGAGCAVQEEAVAPVIERDDAIAALPVDGYIERRTFKSFGEYISDRFVGYHVADDVEFVDATDEIPVSAIMDGTVVRIDDVSGYGGMILVDHGDVNALYGHVDLSSATIAAGDAVTKGQFLANLGDGASAETDGERKHLHFGLYEGEPTRINGYVANAASMNGWLNPQSWFAAQGVDMTTPSRAFDADDRGSDVFHLEFIVPEGMEVEYVPSIQALNIFTLDGEGTARERSQIFIRYFDASEFLILSTVDVYATERLTVGRGNYDARRYDIEKKDDVASFADQPSWRNERHIVTDLTNADGYGRYYVVAANLELGRDMYEFFLRSMTVK